MRSVVCALLILGCFVSLASSQEVVSGLVIHEIHYDPDVKTDPVEFIEIFNAGAAAVSLKDWDSLLLVKNREAFVERYGTDLEGHIAGEFKGKLSNGGEGLEVADMWQGVILSFAYDDAWRAGTDGDGLSLELVNEDLNTLEQSSAWSASTVQDGSPGSY